MKLEKLVSISLLPVLKIEIFGTSMTIFKFLYPLYHIIFIFIKLKIGNLDYVEWHMKIFGV